MKTYIFDEKEKVVNVFKDCKKCLHCKVCIFHYNINELSKKKYYISNE